MIACIVVALCCVASCVWLAVLYLDMRKRLRAFHDEYNHHRTVSLGGKGGFHDTHESIDTRISLVDARIDDAVLRHEARWHKKAGKK